MDDPATERLRDALRSYYEPICVHRGATRLRSPDRSQPMDNAALIRMANQIASYFEVYPRSEALDGIAKHVHNTWERRMRDALRAIIDAGGEGLKPLFVEAMNDYFKGAKSQGRKVVVDPRERAPKGAQPSFADGGGDAG